MRIAHSLRTSNDGSGLPERVSKPSPGLIPISLKAKEKRHALLLRRCYPHYSAFDLSPRNAANVDLPRRPHAPPPPKVRAALHHVAEFLRNSNSAFCVLVSVETVG